MSSSDREQDEGRRAPPPLFKYFPLNFELRFEWLESIIVGHQLRLSSSTDFNDPFDCLPEFVAPKTKVAWEVQGRRWMRHLRETFGSQTADQTWVGYRKHSPEQLAALLEKASRRAAELVGICCLTEVDDSVLMWSHYGDQHRGICLRFELNQFPISDLHLVRPVVYQEKRPIHHAVHFDERAENVADKLLVKAKFWKYEREWRTLIDRGAHKVISFPPNALTGVVFGARCTAEHRERVREMIKRSSSSVRLWEANISRRRFELEIVASD